MKANSHFILLTRDEFRPWLQQQDIKRSITRLQVHHTWSPAYKDCQPGEEFKRLEAMRSFHMNTNGWRAIGQNITTFPNGLIGISLERNLNEVPAGIAGANTGALCIENIGNFDKGGDTLTVEQRDTIVHLYAALAEKLKLTIDTSHIVYHAWYTPSGQRLSDYTPGESSKTCPGTNFFGYGNTVTDAMKSFIPAVQAEYNRLTKGIISKEEQPMTAAEKKEFDELKETVAKQAETIEKLSKKVNITGSQKPPTWAEPAIIAAKKAGIIKESDDKSQIFFEVLQTLFNAGLIGGAK